MNNHTDYYRRKCLNFISFHLYPLPPENTALPSSLSQKDGDPPGHIHTQLNTQTVTQRQREKLLCRDRGQSVMSYPEFSAAVGFLAALSKDRHADSDLSQRLLRCLHQQHLEHTTLIDVCVKAGLPSRVHGRFPLNQGLTSFLEKDDRERENI